MNLHASLFNNEGLFSKEFLRWLERGPDSILLETVLADRENDRHYLFLRPSAVLRAVSPEEVEPRLMDMDRALKDGMYVAGYMTYEAASAFESVLPRRVDAAVPLLWFGIYEEPVIVHAGTLVPERGKGLLRELRSEFESFAAPGSDVPAFTPLVSITKEEYRRAIERIRRLIVEGETYQVNFTFKMRFPFKGNLAELYESLRRAQRVPYAAFLNVEGLTALSLSPELFFRIDGETVTLRPMKGTAPRGRTLEEDLEQKEWLRTSEKNRAENLMIVDLLRNDAGRIARPGGVEVKSFFDIERFETVYQATSTIDARLRKNTLPSEILRCLFPCGSVTGAPKIRTMQIIHELEKEPRGIYTGSIGFFAPERKAVFSVAIRTVVVRRESGDAELGVGSGIVHDSDADLEYEECLLKSAFLTERPEEFQLIETLRWDRSGGWLVLEEHLNRLKKSSEYFGFRFDEEQVRRTLAETEMSLKGEGKKNMKFRVRMMLGRNGQTLVSRSPLEPLDAPVKAKVSMRTTDSGDRFLFHKTTKRDLYEQELKQALGEGYYEVLFRNEKGEVTEGARTNVLIRKGNLWLTPPVACGALPGTYRAHLLKSGSMNIVERPFTLEELFAADEIFLCNALRGLIKTSVDAPRGKAVTNDGILTGTIAAEH